MPGHRPRQERGQQRRDAIVASAYEILLEQGFAAVSHRAVASRAGVPLGSTTYYFGSLDDLLAAAARVGIEDWLAAAERVTEHARPTREPEAAARVIVRALLSWPTAAQGLAHYEMLLGTARHPAVAAVLRELRPRIDGTIGTLLDRLDLDPERTQGQTQGRARGRTHGRRRLDPALVLAVVDGAVVSALSEGHRTPRSLAVRLVTRLLELPGGGSD